MAARIPALDPVRIDEPDVGVVDEGGCLKGLPGSRVAHVTAGASRYQRPGRRSVASCALSVDMKSGSCPGDTGVNRAVWRDNASGNPPHRGWTGFSPAVPSATRRPSVRWWGGPRPVALRPRLATGLP